MNFKLEHIANMIYLSSDDNVIFKAWNEAEFTERKFKNQVKKLEQDFDSVTITRMF